MYPRIRRRAWSRVFLSVFMLLVALNGCTKVKSAPGPIDGTYNLTAWTCASIDILGFLKSGSVTSIQETINSTTGDQVVSYSGGCVRTQPFTASYPAADSATISVTTPSCTSQCTNQCNGYVSQTSTYSYTVSGTTLTVTRTLQPLDVMQNDALQGAGCSAGQVETQTLVKQ